MKKRVRLKVSSLCKNFTLHRGTHPFSPGFYVMQEDKIVAVFPSHGSIKVAQGLVNRIKITNPKVLK
jgi:hypothetical protein